MTLVLPTNLAKMADVTSADCGRAAMMGVRVFEYLDSYRLEATDGRRLIVVRGPSDPEDTARPKLEAALETAPIGQWEGIIPADAWRKAFQGAKKEGKLALRMGEGEFAFAFADQVLKGQCVEGRFPPVADVIPKLPPIFSVPISPLVLAKTLQAMAAVGSDESPKVLLHYYGKNHPLGLSLINGPQGQFADGLVMPLFEDPPRATAAPKIHEPKDPDEEDTVTEPTVVTEPTDCTYCGEPFTGPSFNVENENLPCCSEKCQAGLLESGQEPVIAEPVAERNPLDTELAKCEETGTPLPENPPGWDKVEPGPEQLNGQVPEPPTIPDPDPIRFRHRRGRRKKKGGDESPDDRGQGV